MTLPAHGACDSQFMWMSCCAQAREYARKDSHSHRFPAGHSHVSVIQELKFKINSPLQNRQVNKDKSVKVFNRKAIFFGKSVSIICNIFPTHECIHLSEINSKRNLQQKRNV